MTKWSDIAAEVGEQAGYREALVMVFKAHEGEETDERDKYDRVVKVTQASFARHFGIAKETFNDWIRSVRKPDASGKATKGRQGRGKERERDKDDPDLAAFDFVSKLATIVAVTSHALTAAVPLSGDKAAAAAGYIEETRQRLERIEHAMQATTPQLKVVKRD